MELKSVMTRNIVVKFGVGCYKLGVGGIDRNDHEFDLPHVISTMISHAPVHEPDDKTQHIMLQ